MLTIIIESIAVVGRPSQLAPVEDPWHIGRCIPEFMTQLMTLKVGSNIHRQERGESTLGMIQGRSNAARTKRWPGNTWFRSRAMVRPSVNFTIVVQNVYEK